MFANFWFLGFVFVLKSVIILFYACTLCHCCPSTADTTLSTLWVWPSELLTILPLLPIWWKALSPMTLKFSQGNFSTCISGNYKFIWDNSYSAFFKKVRRHRDNLSHILVYKSLSDAPAPFWMTSDELPWPGMHPQHFSCITPHFFCNRSCVTRWTVYLQLLRQCNLLLVNRMPNWSLLSLSILLRCCRLVIWFILVYLFYYFYRDPECWFVFGHGVIRDYTNLK